MTTLESFVNTIRNLYQPTAQTESQKPANVNYIEVYNAINTNLQVFNENSNSLLDNVLPVFTLPEFTLPNMAVLYAIITKSQQQLTPQQLKSLNEIDVTANLGDINQDRLINELENCLNHSDEKQVMYGGQQHILENQIFKIIN